MKTSSCLINVARGGVVDWAALSAALKAGDIAACCRDKAKCLTIRSTAQSESPSPFCGSGKIYNVAKYLPYHPGGEKELMRGVGKADQAESGNELPLTLDLDRIVFDNGVGQQLFAHIRDLRACFVLIGFAQIKFQELALAHLIDSIEAKRTERMLDGFALRIENAVFQRDMDSGFHALTITWTIMPVRLVYWMAFGPLRSIGPASGSTPRRRATRTARASASASASA